MYGMEVILILVVTRVVLPVFVLLMVGELARRRDANYWSRS